MKRFVIIMLNLLALTTLTIIGVFVYLQQIID